MSPIRRLLREYNLISAAVVAALVFALAMEWITLTEVQLRALLGVIAAWLLVLRFAVTPIADPVLPAGHHVRTPEGEDATVTRNLVP